MATPSDKLAQSLAELKRLQDSGIIAIRTRELSRTHRERLLKNGFIQEVMKGWYIPSRSNEPTGESSNGESTTWYASFWGFCSDYLSSRFGDDWCLSPEQSINLHIGDKTVPRQLLVRSPKGGNKPTGLLHNTSILDLRLDIPTQEDITTIEGMQVMSIHSALIACSPNQFSAKPIEMRSVLSMISDASDLLRKLLEGNHSTVAGRLAGAFRNIGRNKVADTIIDTMKSAGYTTNEVNPFEDKPAFTFGNNETSPYINRLRLMWESFRQPIAENFPASPEKISDINAYIKKIDDIYATDAYHSLSIEGYRVNEGLIERVRSGNWNPDNKEEDNEHKNALAARGYWQAFQAVKNSIKRILAGENPSIVADEDHGKWVRELFSASVVAGIIQYADLAGYRNRPAYIRKSMHTPANYSAVRDLMPAFFELLQKEENPAVRVVLGHFIFVYIHPYIDGNGRTGRFLMNAMLAAGGYSWIVIPVERRDEYMDALEIASVNQDIVPFTKFLASLISKND